MDPTHGIRREEPIMAVINDGAEVVDAEGRIVALDDVAAVIDADELQDARDDPKWQAFYQEAVSYRAGLLRAGRSS
jgi:hypothetical protein